MPLLPTPVPDDLPTLTSPTPRLPFDPAASPADELARQVEVYVALGFAALAGIPDDALRDRLAPLVAEGAALARDAEADGVPPADHAALLLVLDTDVNDAAPAMRRGPRPGVSVIGRDEAAGYRPIDGVTVPAGPYLVAGVDTGTDLRAMAPAEALRTIVARGRTPLTMAEGVALAVVRPDLLRPSLCFSLPGARAGDQRVPAVWISERRAKLGWCWDGNPHTWLGSACARERRAP